MSNPTPGAGGAYRYDPMTDAYVRLEAAADSSAPLGADDQPPSNPEPTPTTKRMPVLGKPPEDAA
jgi:hypothetical protein